MPTFDDIITSPEDLAALKVLVQESQELTGLPAEEAGCFLKCSIGMVEVLNHAFPDLNRVLLNLEVADMLAGEPTRVLSHLVEAVVLTSYAESPGLFLVALRVYGRKEGLATTIPLTPEEVPTTPPLVEDQRGKVWNLYPSKLPNKPALFTGKGVGEALRRARSMPTAAAN